MDISKLLSILCCFVLIVCLTLCITTLVVLRNAISEQATVGENAEMLMNSLDNCIQEFNEMRTTENDSISVSTDPSQESDIAANLIIRESNGVIGVYTTDGTLLHLLDVSVGSLPASDREALKNGIKVTSWRELIDLIQDYTA